MNEQANRPKGKSKLVVVLLLILIIIPLLAGQCGGDPPDNEKPSVVSTSPTDGEKGVKEDAKITVVFSESMDITSTEKACESSDIGEVSFTWSADSKTVVVKPKKNLEYSPNASSKFYNFKITTTAQDLAGNPLDMEKQLKFSTFRTLTQRLISEAKLDGQVWSRGFTNRSSPYFYVGDWGDNTWVHSFLSFDLSELPNNVLSIVSAKLGVFHSTIDGSPYKDLKDELGIVVFHVNYGTSLEDDDFNTKPLLDWFKIISDKAGVGWRNADVASRVQDDFNNSDNRHHRSQYMLRFAQNSDGGDDVDVVEFFSADYKKDISLRPYLEISFLGP